MAEPDDKAFLKKYGTYKPQTTSVPVATIRPVISFESAEESAARQADEQRKKSEETRQENTARLAQEAADRAARGEPLAIEEKKRSAFESLFSKYEGDARVQKYQKVLPIYDAMLTVASRPNPSKADDNILITQFSKIKDPTTGVLGGEFETSKDVQTLFDKYRTDLQGLYDPETGFVSPEARKQFIRATKDLVASDRTAYTSARSRYSQVAKTPLYGLNPAEVIGEDFANAYAPEVRSKYIALMGGEPEAGEKGVPGLQVAQGDRIATDRDIEIASLLQGAWQSGKSIDEINALTIQLGTEPLPPETIEALQTDPNRQIRFTPNRSGVREGAGPGMGSAAAAGAVRGFFGNVAEEALSVVSPEAAAKLQAAGEFAQEQYPITTMAGEVVGGALSPLSRVGPGGTILGEAVRGGIYGGIYGAGEPAPDAGILERALPAVVGLTTGAGTGALAQRFLGGGGNVTPAAGQAPVGGIMPEVPTGAVSTAAEESALSQRINDIQTQLRNGVGSPELEQEALALSRQLRDLQTPEYMRPGYVQPPREPLPMSEPTVASSTSEEAILSQRLRGIQDELQTGVGSPQLEQESLAIARRLRWLQTPDYMKVGAVEPPPIPSATPSAAGMTAPVAAAAPEQAAAELGTLINKASGTGGAAKNAQIKLAEQAQINPEAKAAAERLGIDVPADVFSDNPQVRAAIGLTRSLAGSEAEAGFRSAVTNAVDQADNIMREFDAQFVEGAIAPGVVSQRVKDSLTTTRKALNDQADEIYKRVDTLVPKQTIVQMDNLRDELAVIVSEVGEKGLTASEKGLMALVKSKEPIKYGRLAREKSQIGKALKRQESTYGSLDEATLKRLYAALSKDQLDNVGRVAGEEVRRELRGANLIYAKERALGDRIVNAFGADLEGGIANKMRSAITSGAKGEAGDFARLMKTVPDDLRKEVVATALASVARSGRGAEKGGFGFSEFADIYPKLRANPQVYKEIAQALGPKASDTLRDLYQVSKRITEARANVLTTGKANQALVESLNAEGLIARIMDSTMAKRAVGAAAGMGGPIVGAVMPDIMQAMTKGNPDAIRAAGKMFSSPEFQVLLNDVATKGDASERAINQVSMSKPFRSFIATVGIAGNKAKDYLMNVAKSAPTVSTSVLATETTGPETPMAAPTVAMPQ